MDGFSCDDYQNHVALEQVGGGAESNLFECGPTGEAAGRSLLEALEALARLLDGMVDDPPRLAFSA
jgi:hypothetical protein